MSDRGIRVAAVLFGLAGLVTLVLILGQSRLPSTPDHAARTGDLAAFTSPGAAASTGSAGGQPTPGQLTPGASVGGPTQPATLPTATPALAPTPLATPKPTPAPAPKPNPTAPPAPTPTPAPPPGLANCPIFPSSNVWNRRVDSLPAAADSDAMVAAIGLDAGLHPDFSDGGWYGIPFNVVGSATPR